MTTCHGFVPFRLQPLFQFTPIGCGVDAVGQYGNDIHNGNVPFPRIVVPHGTHLPLLEELYGLFLRHKGGYFSIRLS